MRNTYGYIRVSSTDQNEDRQLDALRRAAIPQRNIYMDEQSGKDFNRTQYRRLVKRMKSTLTVSLARNGLRKTIPN